jgi:Ca2+-binding RTX toxin-like protein
LQVRGNGPVPDWTAQPTTWTPDHPAGSHNYNREWSGAGRDTANYSGRNNLGAGTVLSLSLDNIRNDGEPGESDQLSDDIEILKGGTGHNLITGNTKANTLIGEQSSDQILGADGIAGIAGNAGNDTITGGPGADFCTFDAGPPSDNAVC